ncbi:MAG: M15 family metallopeptidase [Parcubacteria group bacterium]
MKNQIYKTLPRAEWDRVSIYENGETLVKVEETSHLKIGLVTKQYESLFYVRKTISDKLLKVSENLPKEISLVLIEGYRTLKSQQQSWDAKFEKLKLENPTWSNEQIEKQVRLVLAKPAPLANHHCGGAVDVTLAYSDGKLLDMGSPYPNEAMGADWHKKFQMLSAEITEEQRKNRKILRDAMEREDFVWYPGEWWHYCWGDRMWAVYSNQTKCFYGSIELDERK